MDDPKDGRTPVSPSPSPPRSDRMTDRPAAEEPVTPSDDALNPELPRTLDASRPTGERLVALAWPVLTQQLLLMCVGLWDQYLAANTQPADPSLHVAYQAAQTTANYVVWTLYSLTILVGVGSTALVARCVGAGDRPGAVRATNQSILL